MVLRILAATMLFVVSAAALAAEPPADRQLMLQLLQRIERLEQEVRQLRGRLEVLEHRQQQFDRQTQNRYQDTDRRLLALEGNTVPGGAPSQSAAPAPGVATDTQASAPGTAGAPGEKAAYESNFALLREGRIDDAITGFEKFLVDYPNGEYSDNAQYWLGEAHYVRRDFQVAKAAFEKVIATYPGSSKLPDARLKLGFTLDELGEDGAAKATLQAVAQDYPGTTNARLAEQRLKNIP